MVLLIVMVLIACIFSFTSIAMLALRNSKGSALVTILSAIGIVSGMIALALSSPRDMSTSLGLDYLGIIVAILGIITTLLLGLQLYHTFNLKEDAKEVMQARQIVDRYQKDVEELKRQSACLSKDINDKNVIINKLTEYSNEIKKQLDDLGLRIVENPEWLYVMTDAVDHILFGIRKDASVDWSIGVPRPIKKELDELRKEIAELKKEK